jgi:hypothetical protein
MLDKATAHQKAIQFILASWTRSDDEPVILEQAVIERDFGWAFHFESRRAIDGDRSRRLLGNGLIIVNRHDGSVRQCGTGLPTEHYLAKYAKMTDDERRQTGLLT